MANLITLVKLTGHHSISDLFRKMKEELKRERERGIRNVYIQPSLFPDTLYPQLIF
jgi:hypothetical protein